MLSGRCPADCPRAPASPTSSGRSASSIASSPGTRVVVVVEHNLVVVAAADWIVDLGPEGGKEGCRVVAEGTPETVAARHAVSHTGRYLKEWLGVSDEPGRRLPLL